MDLEDFSMGFLVAIIMIFVVALFALATENYVELKNFKDCYIEEFQSKECIKLKEKILKEK